MEQRPTTMEQKLKEQATEATTPPEILEELAKSENATIRKVVAQNPNTPTETLLQLFRDFPHQVLQNPIIDLLILEDPNFLYELYQVNVGIFDRDNLPSFFLKWAIKHPDDKIRIAVARSKKTPQYFLEQLANDNKVNVRCCVAINSNTPIHTLEKFIQDSNEIVRLGVSENTCAPKFILEQLAKDPEYIVRLTVAKNPQTPQSALHRLLDDKDDSIRFAVRKKIALELSMRLLI
jgi:hypothetical protein